MSNDKRELETLASAFTSYSRPAKTMYSEAPLSQDELEAAFAAIPSDVLETAEPASYDAKARFLPLEETPLNRWRGTFFAYARVGLAESAPLAKPLPDDAEVSIQIPDGLNPLGVRFRFGDENQYSHFISILDMTRHTVYDYGQRMRKERQRQDVKLELLFAGHPFDPDLEERLLRRIPFDGPHEP